MKSILLGFVIGFTLCGLLVFTLGTDTMFPRPIEFIEKTVYNDKYFYTGFTTEHKIGEKGYVYNKHTMSYDSVFICGYVIENNSLQEGEYSYLVSKDTCYYAAEKKDVAKYNFKKTLP